MTWIEVAFLCGAISSCQKSKKAPDKKPSMFKTPKVESPPTLVVHVSAPIDSAAALEQRVAMPLENALNSLPGLSRVETKIEQGSVQITLQFDPWTNLYTAKRNVLEALHRASAHLPPNIEPPVIVPSQTARTAP